MLSHDDEWSDQLPRVSTYSPSRVKSRKLRLSQDFIADPVNPNVEGLLENIKWSYTAVVDQYGTFYLFSYHL